MTVWIRIGLYLLAGALLKGGLIDDEIRALITTDPELVTGIEAGLSAVLLAGAAFWRKLAKKYGWST
ncbi:hypothetical protein U8C35_07845 [Sinorhizobium medicae]|uniref:hypothetical protein n=1 Tax=Sinorhizobium medicae TaxID=110321 RepID=UPI002AF6BED9|nr:hypothetical protein [Sinorhizobium medicae]WQO60324.1 hypothetical protein U8C35_07845 [Sinorhizobium medicae]